MNTQHSTLNTQLSPSDPLRDEAIGRMMARGWREEQICEDDLRDEMEALKEMKGATA